MATIETSFGTDCRGISYNDSNSISIDVDKEVADMLASLIEENDGSIDNDLIEELIDGGDTTLEDLHNTLGDACVEQDIAYWLEEGDADPAGMLSDQMDSDIESGEFVPQTSFEKWLEEGCYDVEDEDYDEDEAMDEYQSYLMDDEYIPWLNTLDVYTHAEKVGLDVDVCSRDCNYSYTIELDKA